MPFSLPGNELAYGGSKTAGVTTVPAPLGVPSGLVSYRGGQLVKARVQLANTGDAPLRSGSIKKEPSANVGSQEVTAVTS